MFEAVVEVELLFWVYMESTDLIVDNSPGTRNRSRENIGERQEKICGDLDQNDNELGEK